MATSYIYCTTNTDAAVDLGLTDLGPKALTLSLETGSVPAQSKETLILAVPRMLDSGMYSFDTSLSVKGRYIASLQILLRGHGPGSMIWWRWRTATLDTGYWTTEHVSQQTKIVTPGRTYTFTVIGASTFGYDDIYIELSC